MEEQIERLKREHVKPKPTDPFVDPIKEFSRASRVESMVRNWLTYPIEERKRIVVSAFTWHPRGKGNPATGEQPETEEAYQNRMLERWRGLCVVIQEESRVRLVDGKPTQGSAEVAIVAFKHLFPGYDWKTKPQAAQE